ncbi:hypothetical protein H9L39_00481 [Fusarium oxysporum f. sp. albedinis]|nr:hypothetical protein H9L39_00481 [Fusarium oxysporum f. sp. albedinis]
MGVCIRLFIASSMRAGKFRMGEHALCRSYPEPQFVAGAIDNGTRCALEVKQGDTLVYRYCPQLHLCEYQDCQNLRSRHHDQYLPLCDDHRCQYDSCRDPRDGGAGVFCRSHTCNEPYCGAFAPGTDPDDPQRFCERHRQCLRPHCPRLCHTRENGHPTPFCGAHYCEAHDCDDGRERGAFCHAHTCVEPGCGHIPMICVQASTTEEDVAEDLNMAVHSANTTSVTSPTVHPLGPDRPSSALITSAL